MHVQIRFFAAHREKLGTDRLTIDVPPGASVADLIGVLVDRFPVLEPIAGAARVAVNREYAAQSTILHDGDEVAVIPPVAGGRDERW